MGFSYSVPVDQTFVNSLVHSKITRLYPCPGQGHEVALGKHVQGTVEEAKRPWQELILETVI